MRGRQGLNVLMIDAHQPPHQEGSHHGSTALSVTPMAKAKDMSPGAARNSYGMSLPPPAGSRL
jgi:hypothetical protein